MMLNQFVIGQRFDASDCVSRGNHLGRFIYSNSEQVLLEEHKRFNQLYSEILGLLQELENKWLTPLGVGLCDSETLKVFSVDNSNVWQEHPDVTG